jgi:predicted translin family RNA/ssDNA-binding protein
MAPWSREKIGKAAQEVADHLMLVEHVKALQQGQKQMADAIALIDSRFRQFEADMRAAKAETKLEAIKEATHLLQSAQDAFHEKITRLTVKVAQLENRDGASGSLPAL